MKATNGNRAIQQQLIESASSITERRAATDQPMTLAVRQPLRSPKAVISGSFTKDRKFLQDQLRGLQADGCEILSPPSAEAREESAGFVYMRGDPEVSPREIEDHHLDSILEADFVRLCAPRGYLGLSGAFELGFAIASGVPVVSTNPLDDIVLGTYVGVCPSTTEALKQVASSPVQIPRALGAMQAYYRRMAALRGHDKEDAKTCLKLLAGEMKELSDELDRAVGPNAEQRTNAIALEVADVFLYAVHLANVLNVDLLRAVSAKERINAERFGP